MIPFFTFSEIPLGPVSIKIWGLAVAAGIVASVLVARREAMRAGLDGERVLDLAAWVLVPALVFGRIFYVLFYGDGGSWTQAFRVWEGGMSSVGGYVGAVLGIAIFARLSKARLRPYLEAGAFAFPLGYGIGRLGCFLIHDHLGVLTSFPLAVAFPGGPRLDHGLLLSLFGFLLFAAFLLMRRLRGWRVTADGAPRFLPALLISYGIARFALDFLRAQDIPHPDARYLGLALAQWAGAAMVIAGIYLIDPPKRHDKPARE